MTGDILRGRRGTSFTVTPFREARVGGNKYWSIRETWAIPAHALKVIDEDKAMLDDKPELLS
jgi:hypothetical protein